METEYEAKFLSADKDEVRTRLKAAGATLKRPEFLQRRWVMDLPGERNTREAFVRVRDEGGIMTLTWKDYPGGVVNHPKEIEVVVDDFDKTVELMTQLGCIARSYQENRRELWLLDDAKITIDSWPFVEPFVEVEGADESVVERVSKKTGFDWNVAIFSGVNRVYKMKFGDHVQIREMPMLTFDMPNPFTSST